MVVEFKWLVEYEEGNVIIHCCQVPIFVYYDMTHVPDLLSFLMDRKLVFATHSYDSLWLVHSLKTVGCSEKNKWMNDGCGTKMWVISAETLEGDYVGDLCGKSVETTTDFQS